MIAFYSDPLIVAELIMWNLVLRSIQFSSIIYRFQLNWMNQSQKKGFSNIKFCMFLFIMVSRSTNWGHLANLWSYKVLVCALSCEVDTWPRQGKFCASYNVKYLWWFYMGKQGHILCVTYTILGPNNKVSERTF